MDNGIIVCDECGQELDREEVQLWDRVIGQDASGNDIIEQYFDCPRCGHHYCVTVTDRTMRLLIQKRRQLQNRIRLARRNKSAYQMKKYTEEDRELADDLKHRTEKLKEEYLKEG